MNAPQRNPNPPALVRAEIERVLGEAGIGQAGAPLAFKLLSGGNSHITWRVSAGDRSVVVKVAQADGPLAPYDVVREGAMMARARALGAPAPALIGASARDGVDLLIMSYVAGDAPSLWEAKTWLAGKGDAFRRHAGRSLIEALAALRSPADAPPSMSAHYRAFIAAAARRAIEATTPLFPFPPLLARAGDWLSERAAALEGAPASLHHGDFRLGNAVFIEDRVAALLDWERAMIGHPTHDLGYLCLPGMRDGDLIGGVLTESELAAVWRDVMGAELDRPLTAYFRILSLFTEACAMLRALARVAEGRCRFRIARSAPLLADILHALAASIRAYEEGDYVL